jgi:hypothetical protein
MDDHVMTAESSQPGEMLLTCGTDGCGRRVVVRPTSMVVLDRGEVGVFHSGAAAPPGMLLTIGPPAAGDARLDRG